MSNYWKYPHCGKIFEKTPQLMFFQSIGGRKANFENHLNVLHAIGL